MKILFLCGSFEPGRDGVGDYTRRLAEELLRIGHQVAVAAIDDKHITTEVRTKLDDNKVMVLRMPTTYSEDSRLKHVEKFIQEFNPDWLSLQFVPFSFDPKGLNFGLAKKLAVVSKGFKWHIMFHELWVGMSEDSSLKESIWRMLQQMLIRKTLRRLQPGMVHTHTSTYKKYLEKMYDKVMLLPLFSNIHVVHPLVIEKKAMGKTVAKKSIRLVLFGGIHAGAPIKDFAAEAKAYSAAHGQEIELVIVGRSGVEQWKAAGLALTDMGEQSAERVSEILEESFYGIFTTPLALVEKSGSVAAMREHGIHLLCISRPWVPRGVKAEGNPFGILPYYKGGLSLFLESKPDFNVLPTLPAVAKQFIADLTNR